jgi:hypothetical protein
MMDVRNSSIGSELEQMSERQIYRGSGLEHHILETGPVSILRRRGDDAYSVGFLRKS